MAARLRCATRTRFHPSFTSFSPFVPSIQTKVNSFSTNESNKKIFIGRGRGYGAREKFTRNTKGLPSSPSNEASGFQNTQSEKEESSEIEKEEKEGEINDEQMKQLEDELHKKFFISEKEEFGLLYNQLEKEVMNSGDEILPTEIANEQTKYLLHLPLSQSEASKVETIVMEELDINDRAIPTKDDAVFPSPEALIENDFVDFPTNFGYSDNYEMFPEDSDPTFPQVDEEDSSLPQIWEFYNGENSLVGELWRDELKAWAPKKLALAKLYRVVQKKNAAKKQRRLLRKEAKKQLEEKQNQILNQTESNSLLASPLQKTNNISIFHKEGEESDLYFGDLMANIPKDHPSYYVLCDLLRVLANNPSYSYRHKRSVIRKVIRDIKKRIPKHAKWMQPHLEDWSSLYLQYLENKKNSLDPEERLKIPQEARESETEGGFW